MISVPQDLRGLWRAAVVYENPQRSVHCEISCAMSNPNWVKWHIVRRTHCVVGLVRLEVQAIRAPGSHVRTIVVKQNVNGGVLAVLMVIHLGRARSKYDGLVVIASIVHAYSTVDGRFSILRSHSSGHGK